MKQRKSKKKLTIRDYDAKSEKIFCESIPAGIEWEYQELVYNWVYEERHLLDDKEVSKKYNKKYTPDIYFPASGIVLELKGFLRPDAKRRMEVVSKLFTDADIRMVFHRATTPIRKGAKLTYQGWAEKHGFKACSGKEWGDMPREWRDEIIAAQIDRDEEADDE